MPEPHYDNTQSALSQTTDRSLRLHAAMRDAEEVVNSTILKARQICEDASEQAKRQIEGAREKGFQTGFEAGFAEGSREAKREAIDAKMPVVGDLNRLAAQFASLCQSETGDSREAAFRLAMDIAGAQIKRNPEAYFGLYRKAAAHVSNIEKATLKTDALGYEIIKEQIGRYEEEIEGLSDLEVVKVDGEPGTCILETPFGTIDASLAAQIKRARAIVFPV